MLTMQGFQGGERNGERSRGLPRRPSMTRKTAIKQLAALRRGAKKKPLMLDE
jgi:hypothetical protein